MSTAPIITPADVEGIPKYFEIVKAKTRGGGIYDACGKCGAGLQTGTMRHKERIELARVASKHILDPIMLFSELLTAYEEKNGVEFSLAEIGAAVRLLALGGMADMMMAGTARHVDSDTAWCIMEDWQESAEEYRKGGAA